MVSARFGEIDPYLAKFKKLCVAKLEMYFVATLNEVFVGKIKQHL